MSSIFKVLNVAKNIKTFCNSITSSAIRTTLHHRIQPQQQHGHATILGNQVLRSLYTTPVQRDLMEFFDDAKNWEENEIKVGRAWKLEELRIKSNKDLHQLWYILLKERNMLLTMEHECNDRMELFPSPERIDKVKISMDNLEKVVRERNTAYHLLETGETGERPWHMVYNQLGIRRRYNASEHALPPYMNTKWIESRKIGYKNRGTTKFLLFYREKLYNVKRKAKNRARNQVMMLLRRNPNIDVDVLRNQYPGVDIDKLIRTDKIRGHYVPKVEN